MAAANKVRHLLEEKGDEQRRDMRPIHIRIGHDDDLLITQVIITVVLTRPHTKRLNEIADLLVLGHLVRRRTCHVQDFSAQGKDCLRLPVSRLFGGPASGVTLNNKEL